MIFENLSVIGLKFIFIMAFLGGAVALVADVLGKRIGKAHVRLFGLRPRQNARILTVLSGVLISLLTIGIMAVTSKSARVALFGMEKVAAEIRELEGEKQKAEQALQLAQKEVIKKNGVIKELDQQIKAADSRVNAALAHVQDAQKQVQDLNKAKEQLNGEVSKLSGEVTRLEKNNQRLKAGITTMREGTLFYQAGEVVYAGVMRSGLVHDENLVQLEWLLRSANLFCLQKLGFYKNNGQSEEIPQVLLWQKGTLERALESLDSAKGDKFFRIRTLANVMVGELVPCTIECFENKLIYHHGDVIYKEICRLDKKTKDLNGLMANFLYKVNHASVEAGVLADPITKKVGGMDAESMLNITSQLKKVGKNFVMEAKAEGDIYTSGPVKINFNAYKILEE